MQANSRDVRAYEEVHGFLICGAVANCETHK